jgi:hypothetical protein
MALPFAYDWTRFPAAWFGANDTNWETAAGLDEIGKYSLAIFGWQALVTATNWTASLHAQITQASILKARYPQLPVFLYAGFGFAPGFDANIFDVIRSASDGCPHHQPCRKVAEPHTDWVLETSQVAVYSMAGCEQMGLGYQNPPTDRCWNPMWNLANASARDFFMDQVLPQYTRAPHIDGVFFDGFNTGYQGPSYTPWGRMATNVANCTKTGGAGICCKSNTNSTVFITNRTSRSSVPSEAATG